MGTSIAVSQPPWDDIPSSKSKRSLFTITSDVRDQAFFVVYQGFNLAQLPFSTGRHQWNVNLIQISDFLRFLNYSEFFYAFSQCFTKLAIVLQLKRIFRGTKRDSVYWICITIMVVQTIYFIIAGIIVVAQCNPREKIWNPLLPGTCLNNDENVVISACINLALDFIMLLLPIYAIFRLKIAIKRKVGITAVFATGMLYVAPFLFQLSTYPLRQSEFLTNTPSQGLHLLNPPPVLQHPRRQY